MRELTEKEILNRKHFLMFMELIGLSPTSCATIDADINYVPADGLYHMLIKKEGGTPGIFAATATKLTGSVV